MNNRKNTYDINVFIPVHTLFIPLPGIRKIPCVFNVFTPHGWVRQSGPGRHGTTRRLMLWPAAETRARLSLYQPSAFSAVVTSFGWRASSDLHPNGDGHW